MVKKLRWVSKFSFPIAIGIFFIIYFIKSLLLYDPDFGWHLRMGQLILSHGIPKTDPFSYTMPSYPFVDHEWLTNVLLFSLYKTTGTLLLAFLFSFLTLVTILLHINFSQKRFFFIPFLLATTTLVSFMGIRPQVITWFFFSVLLWTVLDEKKYQRFRLAIPFLMLLWVNMHGGFAIGIALLGIVFAFRVMQKKQVSLVDGVVFVFSVAATFMNPYGYRAWWEVWMQMSDGSLRWSIEEWLPAFSFASAFTMWVLFSLSIVFFFQYFRKLPRLALLLYGIFLLLGLSSMRHMPFWVLIALSVAASSIRLLYQETRTNTFSKNAFAKSYAIFLIIVCCAMAVELAYDYLQAKATSENTLYPVKAIAFLRTHPSAGEIFNHYNYGGYSIWHLPEKKVFIDGRMPSWRWNGPASESNNAFVEWQNIATGKVSFAKAVKKYHIDTVMWFPESKPTQKSLYAKFINSVSRILRLKDDDKGFIKEMKKDGFMVVYQDEKSVIYRKRN